MIRHSGGANFRRLLALLLVMVIVLGIYSIRLFQIQIVQGEDYAKLSSQGYRTVVSIAASRGEIVDRNQLPLVSNRTSYAVVLDYNYFPHGTSEEKRNEQNDCLLALAKILQEQEEQWNDSLPITVGEPYVFEEGRSNGVTRLKDFLRMASYATAEQCLQQMVEKYYLGKYSSQEKRILAGIHYEMETAGFSATVTYTFAGDVSATTMYRILEQSSRFPGVDVITSPMREYVGGTTACHIKTGYTVNCFTSAYSHIYHMVKSPTKNILVSESHIIVIIL